MSNLMGPKEGIVDLLLDQIEEDNKNGPGFQKTPIRPSAAGKCAKELYFELMEFSGRAKYPKEAMSGETDLLLNFGHSVEYHLVQKIKRHFKQAEVRYAQQSLDFGYVATVNDQKLAQHIEGSLDLVLWSDEWKCCIDVKSKGDRWDWMTKKYKWETESEKFGKMKSVQKLSKRAFWVDNLDAFLLELKDPFFEANFRQLNMYLNSEFLRDRKINFGAIIQYQKNGSKLREIRFRPSLTVHEQIMSKFRTVIKAVDEGTPEIVPNEYPSESFKARYCQFCKADVPGSCANKLKTGPKNESN
jgi:hypothetical protein